VTRAPIADAALQCSQACGQLLVGEGLDQIVVGAGVEASHAILHRIARGEHQDRGLVAAGTQATGDLQAADVRQTDVQDDRIETGHLRNLQRLGAVRHELDQVPIALEQPFQQAAEPSVILNDKQVHGRPMLPRIA